ncbi:unnamed protein product [Prorocentrum cordatum]|uniref:Tyr recombinase domain-containing protein n=1 Tax=Prorocentrum cordatum TaxID=2364126 RepID=A0ABN9WU19_9DINO|nr:unnamed protein product [Polarella glacialis]
MMALEKGRCANPVLRQLACQSAARQIATGIQHYHRYSESKRNPTDYDSRVADRFELAPGQTQRGQDGGAAGGPAHLDAPAGAGPHRLRAPPRSRRRPRHVLELYAGCARLTAACLDEGIRCWVPVDISRGAWHDLTNKNVIRVIRSLIVRREVWHVHLGTPCTPFSQATPAHSRAKHFASGAGSVSFTVDLLPVSLDVIRRHWLASGLASYDPVRPKPDVSMVLGLNAEGGLAWQPLSEWQPGQLDWGSSIAQAQAAERDRRRRFGQEGFSGGAEQLAATVARSDFLARRRVKPLTQQHYGRAAAEVKRFAERHHYPQRTPAQRDQLMVDYLQGIFLAGDGIFAARTALYGYAFEEKINPRDASEFPQARLTLKGFSKAAPGEQRDPCPWETALLIIDQCLSSPCPRQRLVGAAAAVAFDGYLRLSELLSVKACNVTCLQHSATSACPQVSISLMPAAPPDCPPSATTKSGEYDDTVIVGGSAAAAAPRRWVARLVRDLKRATPATRPLFPFTAREFEAAFRQAADAAGLQRLRLCPHALRHGGASVDFALKYRSLAEVQRHGRWKCAASVRRYEKARGGAARGKTKQRSQPVAKDALPAQPAEPEPPQQAAAAPAADKRRPKAPSKERADTAGEVNAAAADARAALGLSAGRAAEGAAEDAGGTWDTAASRSARRRTRKACDPGAASPATPSAPAAPASLGLPERGAAAASVALGGGAGAAAAGLPGRGPAGVAAAEAADAPGVGAAAADAAGRRLAAAGACAAGPTAAAVAPAASSVAVAGEATGDILEDLGLMQPDELVHWFRANGAEDWLRVRVKGAGSLADMSKEVLLGHATQLLGLAGDTERRSTAAEPLADPPEHAICFGDFDGRADDTDTPAYGGGVAEAAATQQEAYSCAPQRECARREWDPAGLGPEPPEGAVAQAPPAWAGGGGAVAAAGQQMGFVSMMPAVQLPGAQSGMFASGQRHYVPMVWMPAQYAVPPGGAAAAMGGGAALQGLQMVHAASAAAAAAGGGVALQGLQMVHAAGLPPGAAVFAAAGVAHGTAAGAPVAGAPVVDAGGAGTP